MTDGVWGGAVRRGPDRWSRLPAPPGWLVVAVLLGATLLSIAAAGEGVLPGDVAVSRALHRPSGPVPEALARLADVAGTLPVLMGVGGGVILVLAGTGRYGAAIFLLAVLLSRSSNPELKRLIESPRPTPDLVRITERASAMGFPSGHAMGVTLLYGALLILAGVLVPPGWPRRAAQGAAAGVILMTGFGRVQTGAHWPSDVLGGYLWGTAILLSLRAYRAARCVAGRG